MGRQRKVKSKFINKKRMMTLCNNQSSFKALNNNIMILIIVIKTIILDVTVPRYKRIGEKENEKVEKYQELNKLSNL